MKTFNDDVNYYFLADLHLNHDNIVNKFEPKRPFDTIEEHDNVILNNWKYTISDEDYVFILGDIFWKTHPKRIHEICTSLPGKIYFVKGNHDRTKIVKLVEKHFIRLENCEMIKIHNNYIVISHYPIESWQGKHRGIIHLHGHTHFINVGETNMINRFSVSLENINYSPIELREILKILNK